MNKQYIQILGIVLIFIGFAFTAFLYWTEPRQIGHDNPMVDHQLRENAGPFLCEPTYPMQQDDWCADAALEHRG